MFTRSVLATVALVIAAPAFADGVSSGAAMQAKALGLPVGAYTQAQMSQIELARRDGNTAAEAFLLSQTGGGSVSTSGTAGVSAGNVQLAKSLGVEPGDYTQAELTRLAQAYRDNNVEAIRAILNHQLVSTSDDLGVVTPTKAQWAAQLGVNPADYTTAQLAQLQAIASAR